MTGLEQPAMYNQCIEYLDKGNENNWAYIKANMKELFAWKEWLNDVPYTIKGVENPPRALLNEFWKQPTDSLNKNVSEYAQ